MTKVQDVIPWSDTENMRWPEQKSTNSVVEHSLTVARLWKRRQSGGCSAIIFIRGPVGTPIMARASFALSALEGWAKSRDSF